MTEMVRAVYLALSQNYTVRQKIVAWKIFCNLKKLFTDVYFFKESVCWMS